MKTNLKFSHVVPLKAAVLTFQVKKLFVTFQMECNFLSGTVLYVSEHGSLNS